MNNNKNINDREIVIKKFYDAFKNLDAATMNSCYREDVVFYDPVFGILRGVEVKCMWEMLCSSAKNFSLTFGNILDLEEGYTTCDWVATYTFSATGKTIVNKIRANMLIEDGKIIEHSDTFSVHNWMKQAFGIWGILFGWSSLFQNRIKNKARKSLMKYMDEKGL